MYCSNCGKEIEENAVVCPHCGVPTTNNAVEPDKGGFLWGLLGCCIPVVGLILFLVWKDSKPKTSKAAGIGALVSVGFFVLYIIFVFVVASLIGNSMGDFYY